MAEGKKILLHVCCAPCAPHVLDVLKSEYDTGVFFYNPNIQPYEEYEAREAEIKRFAAESGFRLLLGDYDEGDWLEAVKGYEEAPEGGARCRLCFRHRLEKTAALCAESGYRFFTTTLTVSPHKNAKTIFEEGNRAAERFGLTFLEADFKKKDGYKKSCEMSRAHGFFRQNYCGCLFSRKNG